MVTTVCNRPLHIDAFFVLPFLVMFHAIAIIVQLHLGGDMMYDMKRRKPETTLLPTEGVFNLRHHIGMVKADWILITL